MRNLALTVAARVARNAGLIAAADDGEINATIRIYASQGGTLLAVRTLDKPCGAIRPADGRIVLAVDAATELVTTTGAATWAEWVAADDTVLAAGQVTDEAGYAGAAGSATDTGDIGPWVLSGTSGTQLYAGGVVALTSGVIG
jgi:hypothetical protein